MHMVGHLGGSALRIIKSFGGINRTTTTQRTELVMCVLLFTREGCLRTAIRSEHHLL